MRLSSFYPAVLVNLKLDYCGKTGFTLLTIHIDLELRIWLRHFIERFLIQRISYLRGFNLLRSVIG